MTKAERLKKEKKLKRVKQIAIARKPCGFNIVAFDQATKCGVAYELSGSNNSFVELWDLSIGTRESQGMKWLRFESRLKKFLKKLKIQILAYELPAGRNINPIIHSSKIIAILEKVCVEMDIEYMEFSASNVKSFATGNGNANKDKMKKAATSLWNYKGDDDNEADALHILKLLKTHIN